MGDHCALGFYMSQAGFDNAELMNAGGPAAVASELQRSGVPLERFAERLVEAGAQWLVCPYHDNNGKVIGFTASQTAHEIIRANDCLAACPTQEDLLRDLFAEHGVEVEFTGEGKCRG